MSDSVQSAQGTELPKAAADRVPLINEDGRPFSPDELAATRKAFSGLSEPQRESIRDANADAIASNQARRMLIVSGPGTGKTTLFIKRLRRWLAAHPEHRVAIATFVRKLVTATLRRDAQRCTRQDGSLTVGWTATFILGRRAASAG
jgi:superfamily II DNA or RNA helicase